MDKLDVAASLCIRRVRRIIILVAIVQIRNWMIKIVLPEDQESME